MYSIGGKYQSSPVFSALTGGIYNVTARNASGCISIVTSVTILANPLAGQPGNFTTD